MNKEAEGIQRSRCPLCGGRIVVSFLYQYSFDYIVGRKGRLRKTGRRRDGGPMEVAVAGCENEACDAYWDSDDFFLESGVFVDCKYKG